MFPKLILGVGLCASGAQSQLVALGEIIAEVAEDIADSGILQKDQSQKKELEKLDNMQKELEDANAKLQEIDNKLSAIQDDLVELQHDLTLVVEEAALEGPLSTIKSTAQDFITSTDATHRQNLANNIAQHGAGVWSARETWLGFLDGSCLSCNGKSIIAQQFEKTGAVPRRLAQQMFRTMATAQYLVSWSFLMTRDPDDRDDDEYAGKYTSAWETVMHQAFASTSGCHWDDSLTLQCTGASHFALKTLRYANGTVLTASDPPHTMSLPTTGGGNLAFTTVQCSSDSSNWPVGMHGTTHVPHGHETAYVAGFYLICQDRSGDDDSRWTEHYQENENSKVFDVSVDRKPMRQMSGCVTHMKGHDHSYWASGAKFYSVSAPDPPDLNTCNQPECYQISNGQYGCSSGENPLSYNLDCVRGFAMQAFSGELYTPKGHDIPYINEMTIRCDSYFDDSMHSLRQILV